MLRNILFVVGDVEIIEDRAQDRSHRYLIHLNVNITKMVMKWNFSSTC